MKTMVGAPPEQVAYNLEAARRKAGNELYKILYTQKLPAVVDIEEISMPATNRGEYGIYMPVNEMRIEITVTPVQYRNVTIAYTDDMSLPYRPVTKNWIKRLFRKLVKR
jgi:hypothetical protein